MSPGYRGLQGGLRGLLGSTLGDPGGLARPRWLATASIVLAVACAVLTVFALRGMAVAESRLADGLLGGEDGAMAEAASAPARRFDPHMLAVLAFLRASG